MKFCAICTAETDALVAFEGAEICHACDGEHPRAGRYAFSGGRPDPRSQSANSSDVGQGNRHKTPGSIRK